MIIIIIIIINVSVDPSFRIVRFGIRKCYYVLCNIIAVVRVKYLKENHERTYYTRHRRARLSAV